MKDCKEDQYRKVDLTYKKQMKLTMDAVKGTYGALLDRTNDLQIINLVEAIARQMRVYGNLEVAVKRGVNI